MTDTKPIDQQLENWDLVIEPHRGLLDLHLADLWRYRDLVLLFVRRDFVAVYKQTILGPSGTSSNPCSPLTKYPHTKISGITFIVIFGNIFYLIKIYWLYINFERIIQNFQHSYQKRRF